MCGGDGNLGGRVMCGQNGDGIGHGRELMCGQGGRGP